MDILTINDRPGEYPLSSYYVATAPALAPFPAVAGEIACDACVIGGGYMGLSTALQLAERGFDVVLLEANRVGWGASGRNGGQIHIGQRLDQNELEKLVGLERGKALWALALRGLSLIEDLIAFHAIDCEWRRGLIDADLRPHEASASHAYVEKLARDYGCNNIRPLDQDAIRAEIGTDIYAGGLFYESGGHLHPLKYALGLARAATAARAQIFENSRVTSIAPGEPVIIGTSRATIKARYLVLGCNGYHGDLDGGTAQHVMPVSNFMIATEPLGEARARTLIANNAAVSDSNFVVNYYRLSADHRLLFGGGESYSYAFPSDIAGLVRKRMTGVFPELAGSRIDYAWGGTLGITMNRMPYLRRDAGNIISAGGFSGQGIVMATLCGAVIAEALAGQAGSFDLMAEVPKAPFPGGTLLRWPLLVLAMTWFSLRDRL